MAVFYADRYYILILVSLRYLRTSDASQYLDFVYKHVHMWCTVILAVPSLFLITEIHGMLT